MTLKDLFFHMLVNLVFIEAKFSLAFGFFRYDKEYGVSVLLFVTNS